MTLDELSVLRLGDSSKSRNGGRNAGSERHVDGCSREPAAAAAAQAGQELAAVDVDVAVAANALFRATDADDLISPADFRTADCTVIVELRLGAVDLGHVRLRTVRAAGVI